MSTLLESLLDCAGDKLRFWNKCLDNLGAIAISRDPAKTSRDALELEKSLPGDVHGIWRRLLAAEWLLGEASGYPLQELSHFRDEKFLGEGTLSAGDLLYSSKGKLAAAVIPIASDSGDPQEATVWVVDNGKGDCDWEERGSFIDRRLSLYRMSLEPAKPISGPSWQLGASLAVRCLESPKWKMQLARDWIATGCVADGHVKNVGMANKLKLASERIWLIPTGLSAPKRSKEILTLDAAWSVVAGATEHKDDDFWRDEPEELHSFTSQAREPVIGVALLSKCKKLVLWHTDNIDHSKKPAEDIEQVLKALRKDMKVDLREISSSNMRDVEEKLEDGLKRKSKAYFNVTQGNRLMAFAVHSLAKRMDIVMFYRDVDNEGLDFTAISYNGQGAPVTYIVKPKDSDISKDIKWDELFRKPGNPRKPEKWTELLSRIKIREE